MSDRVPISLIRGILDTVPGANVLKRDVDGRPLCASREYLEWFGGSFDAPNDWRAAVLDAGELGGSTLCVRLRGGHSRVLAVRTRAVDAGYRLESLAAPTATEAAVLGVEPQLLSAALAHADVAVVVVDEAGRVAHANRLARSLGAPETEPSSGPGPTTLASILGAELAVAALGVGAEPRALGRREAAPGGRGRVFEWRAARAEGPVAEGPLVVIGRDVTALHESELRRRESEDRFDFLMRHLPDYPWLYDLRSGGYSCVGEGFARLWGRPPPLEGNVWAALSAWLHPDDARLVTQTMGSLIRAERDLVGFEYRTVHPDGSIHWLYSLTASVRDAAGKPIQLVGVTLDVTARREAEERLRVSEERLRRMSEAMRDGFTLLGADGSILHANEAVGALLGLSHQRIIDDPRSMLEVIHPEDRARLVEAVGGQLTGRSDAPAQLEIRVLRRDGATRWLEYVSWPISADGGQSRQVVGTLRDIEARRAAECELRERSLLLQRSLREKDVLLAEVHHRVKNNLQGIVGLVHLMAAQAERRPLQETVAELEQRILAFALVHDTIYRSADLSSVDMQSYLERLCRMIVEGVAPAGLDVSLEVRADPTVALDLEVAVRLGLIANELVSNALKHAFAGRARGRITVRLERTEEGGARLRVSDDGCGFPDGVDFRSDATLGLRLVSGLARQSHGRAQRATDVPSAVDVVLDASVLQARQRRDE